MQTILVIGEGQPAREMARALTDAGYRVDVRSAAKASDSPVLSTAAAVVVDLAAEGGLDSLPAGRHGLADAAEGGARKTPVLAVLPEEMLASMPVNLAADDLAVYPLRPHELEARVRRLLDRHGPPDSPEMLHQGALAIDTAGYRVFVDGVLVELTFKEYELLRFLATHPNRVYTREALLDKVWGYDYFGGARTVDVHVRRLRSKIETGGHTFVETVRSVGYRFRPSSSSPS
jgi:two-component system, OmpR family, alkaline phosphatase synthesis response regulator PhoP